MYCGYAKQNLAQHTILGEYNQDAVSGIAATSPAAPLLANAGEYTGLVQREVVMKQQENNRMCTTGAPPDGYNYTYAGVCECIMQCILLWQDLWQ